MAGPPALDRPVVEHIRSYTNSVLALGRWLSEHGHSLDPAEITPHQLRAFQAHLLTPKDRGGAGLKNGTVCTRHDGLRLFFKFLEDEDELPNPMRKVQRPDVAEVTVRPLTEEQLLASSCPPEAVLSRCPSEVAGSLSPTSSTRGS